MQSPKGKSVAGPVMLAAQLALVPITRAALPSGVYQTLPGAMVEERGDRVTNEVRVVPLFATLTLNAHTIQPSLTAVITNAVLEGGPPFPLTVRSSSFSQLADGSWRFEGDYLRDLYPSGTQYLFDWRFSRSTNGEPVWNGYTYWAGGHIWLVTTTNVALTPLPWLSIARSGPTSVQISWLTNFSNYLLEHATQLSASTWTTVTNAPSANGEQATVTLDLDASQRFYRLRKP